MKNLRNILLGVLLIGLGVVFAVNSLGIAEIDIFFDGWWTLFIIIPSVCGVISDRDKTGAIIGLVIGAALLLSAQGIIDFSMILKLVFPIILVTAGVSIIFKGFFKKAKENSELPPSVKPVREYAATFSGQDIKFDGEVFEGAELTAAFGGIKCDLRGAVIAEDVVINATATFGGIDILVPDGVNVKIRSSALFGGVSDKKKRVNIDGAKTLYINADAVFGGVDVK